MVDIFHDEDFVKMMTMVMAVAMTLLLTMNGTCGRYCCWNSFHHCNDTSFGCSVPL